VGQVTSQEVFTVASSTPEFSFDQEKGQLHIVCDLNVEGQLSSSGKTIVLSSTRGNSKLELPDGQAIYIGLNVYRYPEPKS
jgi:hypothetical protein